MLISKLPCRFRGYRDLKGRAAVAAQNIAPGKVRTSRMILSIVIYKYIYRLLYILNVLQRIIEQLLTSLIVFIKIKDS